MLSPRAGNLTLWLKGCGLYDRKSTDSSNVASLPPSPSASHLSCFSCDCVNSLGVRSRVERVKRERHDACGTLSSRPSDRAGSPPSCSGFSAHVSGLRERLNGRAGSKLALLSDGLPVNLQVCMRRRTNLKRHCLQDEQFSSKISSIFDHRVRDSSIIESYYHLFEVHLCKRMFEKGKKDFKRTRFEPFSVCVWGTVIPKTTGGKNVMPLRPICEIASA